MYPTSNDWQLSLLVRNGQAVAYEETASWQATVAFDEEVTSIDDGNGALSFPLSLQAGTTTYLHFINQGTSPIVPDGHPAGVRFVVIGAYLIFDF